MYKQTIREKLTNQYRNREKQTIIVIKKQMRKTQVSWTEQINKRKKHGQGSYATGQTDIRKHTK